MTHAEATAYLLDHPTEAVYFRAVDATGHHWRSVPCWIAATATWPDVTPTVTRRQIRQVLAAAQADGDRTIERLCHVALRKDGSAACNDARRRIAAMLGL